MRATKTLICELYPIRIYLNMRPLHTIPLAQDRTTTQRRTTHFHQKHRRVSLAPRPRVTHAQPANARRTAARSTRQWSNPRRALCTALPGPPLAPLVASGALQQSVLNRQRLEREPRDGGLLEALFHAVLEARGLGVLVGVLELGIVPVPADLAGRRLADAMGRRALREGAGGG